MRRRPFSKPVKLAVFDVDRTILRNTSGEMQLIRFLIKHRMLPFTNMIRIFLYFLQNIYKGVHEAVLRNKLYMYGIDERILQSLLPKFYAEHLQSHVSEYAQKKILDLRNQGYTILLLSGTLDFIVQLLIQKLRLHEGIGSKMEIIDHKYTGRIVGPHPFHQTKVQILKTWLDGQDIDYSVSYAFGDSWADVPLLSCFGHPIALNPGHTLTWRAKKRGWQIVRD